MTSNGARLEMTSPSPPVTSESVAETCPQMVVVKGRRYGQRQLGPAPFASFEDLSDELDSPPETARVPLPGIKEDPSSQLQSPSTPLPQATDVNMTEKEEQSFRDSLASSLDAPAPPRIDISRASSSSQHEDSVTSSPERENGTHNLGYREDGTVDLRSSTEELDYIQEPGTVQESEERRKREKMMRRQQQVRDFGDTQSQRDFMERKDSGCSVMSEAGLLCISGRTSRLSSIGSAASGGSVASGASHLSAGSHQSGRSTRSPSPHKMLLETSFCGSKPVQAGESEASSALDAASRPEKPASRPPSSLRSRSPSPHKMLLETSFCGTKQILPTDTELRIELPKTAKRDKARTGSTLLADAKVQQEKVQKQEIPGKGQAEATAAAAGREKKAEVDKLRSPRPNQTKASEQKATKTKAFDLSKKSVSKPKKIISLRDIPGDEIYIPLKGPEVDFEEIIRKASPHPQKKVEDTGSADAIFIPLHSPPESPAKKDQKEGRVSLERPPRGPPPGGATSARAAASKATTAGTGRREAKREHGKREYEVCEDGSIFIPLHSPDEDGGGNDFEEKIKKVDEELRRAREAAERRSKGAEEEERQRKPATLELSDSDSHRSRLSQAHPSGKSELSSGGSRTPSPGSTLSRKSSFASLFRKSEVFSSPDSQGSTARKKSGTFSNILKEAGDGLRERSRSRSKSKDHQPQTPSAARSPSGRKNVFANLFAKKRADAKVESGKENDPSRLDLVFTFPAGAESNKPFDEGDYVIIPLRDPSDPPESPGAEPRGKVECESSENHLERAPSPLVVLEKLESPKVTAVPEKEVEAAQPKKSSSRHSVGSAGKMDSEAPTTSELPSSARRIDTSSASPKGTLPPAPAPPPEETEAQKRTSADQRSGDDAEGMEQSGARERSNEEPLRAKGARGSYFADKDSGKSRNCEGESDLDGERLQRDSSLEIDEKSSKEEILTVTDGGVRKLKLPPEPGDLEDDHERKGLVYQESFEDELPYVPTTLPLERPVGVQIVPVKHRVNEIKTCSIERPRSTTPINPATLEDFVSSRESAAVSAEDKMKISLPRDNSLASKSKSPTRHGAKGRTWFEFAESVLQSPRDGRKSSFGTTPSPPPLPPRSSPPSVLSSSAPSTTSSWINFEELPEKRKLPKRITTVPTLRSSANGGEKAGAGASVGGGAVYSYVSPEDCQCECHDHNASHGKEVDHERGRARESEAGKPRRGDGEAFGCRKCSSGAHGAADGDIEERPLLEADSEEEDAPFPARAPSPRGAPADPCADGASHSSDSSGGRGSDEASEEAESTFASDDATPFGMDLELDGSRSGLFSQDACSTPDDAKNAPSRRKPVQKRGR